MRVWFGALAVFATGLAAGAVGDRFLNRRIGADRPAVKCEWPQKLDAVAAAPKNHRVLLENDRVRVLEVTVAPGERQPLHAHCLPSVLSVLDGGHARDYDAAGKVMDEGSVIPAGQSAPLAFWLEQTPPHAMENLDSQTIRLIRVELK